MLCLHMSSPTFISFGNEVNMYKRISHSQTTHNIVFKDMMMSPQSFLMISDIVQADHVVDTLNLDFALDNKDYESLRKQFEKETGLSVVVNQ